MTIQFIDLKTQQQKLGNSIPNAIAKVLEHGNYIFGPEVQQLEQQLSTFWKIPNALACSNGTDAIRLALMSENIQPTDTIIAPAFTYIATLEAPKILNAQLFLCDVCPQNYIITPEILTAAIHQCKKQNLNPKAVISVDLFGMPIDYQAIKNICAEHNLTLISDSAQSFGAFHKGKSAAHFADYATVSFFPAKVLGAYGDGGGLFYGNDKDDKKLRSIAFHGHNFHGHGDTDEHLYIGDNIRIGTLQAAVLLQKLTIFADELKARRDIADRYHNAFHNLCGLPSMDDDTQPVWAQYSLTTNKRDDLQAYLQEHDIPTRIYYKRAAQEQPPFKDCPADSLENTKFLQDSILSLPIHPYLTDEEVDYIISHVVNFFS